MEHGKLQEVQTRQRRQPPRDFLAGGYAEPHCPSYHSRISLFTVGRLFLPDGDTLSIGRSKFSRLDMLTFRLSIENNRCSADSGEKPLVPIRYYQAILDIKGDTVFSFGSRDGGNDNRTTWSGESDKTGVIPESVYRYFAIIDNAYGTFYQELDTTIYVVKSR